MIDPQYRRPSGPLGRYIGAGMARDHRPENLWTVGVLDPQPADRILEIGFGPGVAVEALAELVTTGQVAGVDFSRAMVAAARRRNAAAVRAGRVDLRHGDAERLPFPDETFDKVFGIHTVYFWPRPVAAMRQARRVLRPGGQIVLTILPREHWNPGNPTAPAGTPDCYAYTVGELLQLYAEGGFANTRVVANAHHPASTCVVALKP